MKTLSILVPVYNEEQTLPYFLKELGPIIDELSFKYTVNLVFSDNSSSDGTHVLLKSASNVDSRINYIRLSRNFGYQGSILALLNNIQSDAYVIIDVDCEDPPGLILDFVRQYENGYSYVYGERKWRNENILVTLMRKIFYRLTKLIADGDFIVDVAEFSLFDDKVKRAALRNNNTFPFLRSELAYVGFKRIGIPYRRNERKLGFTHYNFVGMFKFAIGGILSSSTFPLRLNIYAGIILIVLGLLCLFATIFYNFKFDVFLLLTANYLIMCAIGLSTYLARTYKNTFRRPVFVIESSSDGVNIMNHYS